MISVWADFCANILILNPFLAEWLKMKDIKFKISHALELLTGLIGWDARRFLVPNVYHFMTYVLFILMMTHMAAFFSFDVVEAMMYQAWLKVLVECCQP